MKHVIFSDVHGNLFGLNHVLAFAEQQSVENLWCLGDLVGYNGYPNECVSAIVEHKIPTVKGNHEALLLNELEGFHRISEKAQHTLKVIRKILKPEFFEFLRNLPFSLSIKPEYFLLHANFFNLKQTVNTPQKAQVQFQEMVKRNLKIVFFGHTHRPEIYEYRVETAQVERISEWEQLQNFQLKENCLYLVNPGTIGVSRHGLPYSFVIFDDEENKVFYQRIQFSEEELKTLHLQNRKLFGGVSLKRLPAIAREKVRKLYYRLSK